MIDPVTAFGVATATFNTIKKAVAAGKEIEQVAGQLGKWWGAIADYNTATAAKEKQPLFKKLLHDGSVEQEALERTIHRQKLLQMEKELRELIVYAYGQEVYSNMLQLRREIRMEREAAIAKQKARQRAFIDNIFWGIIFVVVMFIAGWVFYLLYTLAQSGGRL